MKIALFAKGWDHEVWAQRISDVLPEADILGPPDTLGDPEKNRLCLCLETRCRFS